MSKNPAYNTPAWRKLSQLRRTIAANNHEPCIRCGHPIDYTLHSNHRNGPTTDHLHPLAHGGPTTPTLDQLAPAHRHCNSRHGQRLSTQRRKPISDPRPPPPGAGMKKSPPGPRKPTAARTAPAAPAAAGAAPALTGVAQWMPDAPDWWGDVPWLADLPKPELAAWPRLISPPHPAAVGTYGPEAERLAEVDLGMGERLRWWVRVALRMQLQHDADGQLLVHEVVESGPRRIGKSVRIRVTALHRLRHATRWGEEQLVLHTGKDLPICKEIIRKAWPAATRWGWKVRQTNGQEEIEEPGGSRWAVRGRGSVYGYDTTVGMVDEGWGVEATVVDDGLEASLLERLQPQLVMTSTAHRRATTLMRRRLVQAQSLEDPGVLLLLWGAHPDAPIGDPRLWRGASPFNSPARDALMARKWARALAGEVDPEDEDDDPVEAFRAQLLNVWPRVVSRAPVLVAVESWQALRVVDVPGWTAAGVEASFGHAPVVALAGRRADGRVVVSVRQAESMAAAAALVAGVSMPVVGKSLLRDPAWVGRAVEARSETAAHAVAGFRRLVDEGLLLHDGGSLLGEQVTHTEVLRTVSGVSIVSSGRVDAIKAAGWAAAAAGAAQDWFVY